MAKKRARLALHRGLYLEPPWTVLAEILGHDIEIVRIYAIQISLCYDKLYSISSWKTTKKTPKMLSNFSFLKKLRYRYDTVVS